MLQKLWEEHDGREASPCRWWSRIEAELSIQWSFCNTARNPETLARHLPCGERLISSKLQESETCHPRTGSMQLIAYSLLASRCYEPYQKHTTAKNYHCPRLLDGSDANSYRKKEVSSGFSMPDGVTKVVLAILCYVC